MKDRGFGPCIYFRKRMIEMKTEDLAATLKKSVLAGIMIGIGCYAYISVESKYIGAFLFSIGLVTILSRGQALFTGRLCNDKWDPKDLLIVWLGNLVGTLLIASCCYVTGAGFDAATAVYGAKFSREMIPAGLSAVLCEVCIYVAVMGYRKIESDLGKYLSVILGVMVFILAGFEHCVADMFYFFTGVFAGDGDSIPGAFALLAVITLGNMAGAFVMKSLDSSGPSK